MTELVAHGTWVEIHKIALDAGKRTAQLPEDTRQVPLELRVKGFLVADAAMGDEAEIETPTGRRLRGRLVATNPAYSHSFGPPIPELSSIGGEVRAILREQGWIR
jgi:hypothetical protein